MTKTDRSGQENFIHDFETAGNYEIRSRLDSISISESSITRFIGYGERIVPEPVQTALSSFFGSVFPEIDPEAGFRILPDVIIEKKGFYCGSVFFDTGPIVARQLAGAEYIVVFAATAGRTIDESSRKATNDGDMLFGYTIDSAGSVIAENLADSIEKSVGNQAARFGLGMTNRYSPGYCGWNTAEQQKLFSLLPPRFCSITLTESCLMIPIKSVSGVIGIGRDAVKKDYECKICDRKDCIMKKYRDVDRDSE
jgi:hypothetical protein